MKKFIQNVVSPFVMFSAGLILIGCEQANTPDSTETQTSQSSEVSEQDAQELTTESTAMPKAELKSGNMFYIVRDVADMQLKAGDYVEQLKQTQTDLQTAIADKDQAQLQDSADTLKQQLTGFNQALSSLNLKSQEIESIRKDLLQANQQVLATPLLNGEINVAQVDFKKIEKQMGNIQLEMVKLASMMIPDSQDKDAQKS
jgi:predicted  nucleic acid-binding Zn-ribbon protein